MRIELSKKKPTSIKVDFAGLWLPISTFLCIALYVCVALNLDPIYSYFAGIDAVWSHGGFWFWSVMMWGVATFICALFILVRLDRKDTPDDVSGFVCFLFTNAYAAYSFASGGVAMIWLLCQAVPAAWNWLLSHGALSYLVLACAISLSAATYYCRRKSKSK